MSKEAVIYDRLKKNCKSIMFKRVENMLEVGTPDIYFCNKLNRGWIESKEVDLGVKKATVIIPFRPGQLDWLTLHEIKGGVSLVAIVTKDLYRRDGIFFLTRDALVERIRVLEVDDFHKAVTGHVTSVRYVKNKDLEMAISLMTTGTEEDNLKGIGV